MTSPFAALKLSDVADRCAVAIVSRGAASGMLPGTLLERLASRTGLAVLEVAHGLRELHGRGLVTGINRSGRPVGKVRWTGPEPTVTICEEEHHWKELLAAVNDEEVVAALAGMHAALSGLSRADMAALLEGILQMRAGCGELDPWVWSAQHLLGSSKALRGLRPYLVALGIEVEPVSAGRYYVITAGPVEPDAVLLIENPRVFSAIADSSHAKNILAVASYGYGLTMENFGQRLLAGAVIACPASGEQPDLRSLVSRCPWYFWGDHDQEGLRIFQSLRQQLPGLRLSCAYKAMEDRIVSPGLSHPYHALFEKESQRKVVSEDPDVVHLAGLCEERAVDQETIVPFLGDIDLTKPYDF